MRRRVSRAAVILFVALVALGASDAARAQRGPIEARPLDVAAFLGTAEKGPIGRPVALGGLDEFEATFGAHHATSAAPWLEPSVRAFFANGGRRCWVLRVGSADALGAISPGDEGPLAALGAIDEIGAVAIPGVTRLATQQALIMHCERTRRMAILDAPRDADIDAVVAHRGFLPSSAGGAALYHPWLIPLPGVTDAEVVPPSGHVAGLFARVDLEQGPWRSPVGALRGVAGLADDIGDAEQDSLQQARVNPIREFAGRGIQVWGARTLSSDVEWTYVAVRRLALFLERSITSGTSWAVFEPNGPELWEALAVSIEGFLTEVWRQGGLQGATPREAFFVRVDRTTMSAADLDAGRTVALVGVAPLRPAEFTLLRHVIERPTDAPFRRGDANGDGARDISDVVAVLSWLFLGAPLPGCEDALDATDAGEVSVTSAVFLLDHLFQGGAAPPPPGASCGADPTEDSLSPCELSLSGC